MPDVAKLEAAVAAHQAPARRGRLHHAGPNQVLYSVRRLSGPHLQAPLDGKVLGVLGESGKQLKQFGWIHEIACPSENVLYVAELLNCACKKLILHP
jgi:hypothetical protein